MKEQTLEPDPALQAAYAAIKEEATRLAGHPEDIPQRVAILNSIYCDSGENHTFPQVALHGSLWARGFFETTGKLGRMIQYRYFYSVKERTYRMGLLDRFAVGFRTVNRSVFIDTYTNYYFTRRYTLEPGRAGLIHPELHVALNDLHAAREAGRALGDDEKKRLYLLALQWEQEVTVAPGVKAEVARFDCPVLRSLCLRPVVRFAYFPAGVWMVFKNFADTAERIQNATRSYDLAVRTGWPRVVGTMQAYRALPEEFFRDAAGFTAEMKKRILSGEAAFAAAGRSDLA